MIIIIVASIVVLDNIPFGYWRVNVDKFSLLWILSIHLPIPFIILLRIYSGTGLEIITYPIMIIAFFLGQLAGVTYYDKKTTLFLEPVTSCLFMDMYRRIR